MEKSKMKLWKKIVLIIAVMLIVFIIITLRKFIILTKLENVAKDIINSNNYYAEQYSLHGDSVSIRKSYNKDSKYLTTIERYEVNIPETRKLTIYKGKNEELGIIQSGKTKVAMLNGNTVGGQVDVNTYSGIGLGAKIQLAVMTRIITEECSNRECYLVEGANGWKTWIEKESGIIIREINGGIVTDFNYEFNIVKDEDITKPDISECEILENN